jgi:hypothetical protein
MKRADFWLLDRVITLASKCGWIMAFLSSFFAKIRRLKPFVIVVTDAND